MRTPQQFIKDLTFEQKAQIIKDFEEFGEDRGDGDSELRRVARQMAKEYDSHVSMWMEMIANMVAHDLAREFIENASIFNLQSAVDTLQESQKSSGPKIG